MNLAVEWRPTSFSEMFGNHGTIGFLSVQPGNAYLLHGPAGTGKTTAARILSHGYEIVEIDAASNSGVADMRTLVDSTRYKSLGKDRCIIIDECHRLSAQAWDVLLKPLESTNAPTQWIFCTTEPGKVPKTIRTRLLEAEFSPLNRQSMMLLLKEVKNAKGLSISKAVAEAIVDVSDGLPREALNHLGVVGQGMAEEHALELLSSTKGNKQGTFIGNLILQKKPITEIMSYIKENDLGQNSGEGLRIQTANYLAKVATSTSDPVKVMDVLDILSNFDRPYDFAPNLPAFMVAVYDSL